MTSIIKDRQSDVILNSLNRLKDAKDTDSLMETEFADLLILIGDLNANQIRRGLVSKEEVETRESYLPSTSDYFKRNHKDIARARKIFLEGDDIALQEANKRTMMAGPVQSYGLRK